MEMMKQIVLNEGKVMTAYVDMMKRPALQLQIYHYWSLQHYNLMEWRIRWPKGQILWLGMALEQEGGGHLCSLWWRRGHEGSVGQREIE